MVDITHKFNTLRVATAEATVEVGSPETIVAIEQNAVPKGNVLESARVAALFGIKKTPELIPDCHPLPVEYTAVAFELSERTISIKVTAKTVYKTGVEVEAMHAASVAALTIYDMLKPIDKQVEIGRIRLVEKKGGKSDRNPKVDESVIAGVVVCSDSISRGEKSDRAGKAIMEKLQGYAVPVNAYTVIPDEMQEIQKQMKELRARGCRLIIFTGGTGLSPRDVTPESVIPLLDRRIPGIEEAIRKYGQDRTPYAMLSRSVAGTYQDALVLALPGSTKGAIESMDAVFPAVLHLFSVFKGTTHDTA